MAAEGSDVTASVLRLYRVTQPRAAGGKALPIVARVPQGQWLTEKEGFYTVNVSVYLHVCVFVCGSVALKRLDRL